MAKKRILILGAGLAGLSAAWHLQRKGSDCLIFEKEAQAGGLCRSKNLSGFTFDYCGHLLHFKHRVTFNLIKNLLGENLLEHKKNAWVYSHSSFSRYPFQANLYGLPRPVIKECLLGFIRTFSNGRLKKKKDASFLDWIKQVFGPGIARHFMVPYNTKFWTVAPQNLTCEWLDGFVPVPSLREIIEGTIGEINRPYGYNAVFWYPKNGGIQEIPRLLSRNMDNLYTFHEAQRIDIKKRAVYFKNGKRYSFDALVYSLPLPEILKLCGNIPYRIKSCLERLKYNSIFNLNLGIDKKNISNKHWIYFPEKKYIFYRAGFPSNFSLTSCPADTSSIYIEAAYSKDKPPDKDGIVNRIIKDLISASIIENKNKILVKDVNDIRYGYIIYDRHRRKAAGEIKKFLEENNIFPIGRYGAWSYMSMEDVLLDGKRIAENLS